MHINIFDEIGLEYTIVDADSGNIGGSESHEFHVLADTGEDDLLIDETGKGVNLEIAKSKYDSDDVAKIKETNNLIHKKGIEVGHIFKLGTKYSQSMDLSILDAESKKQTIEMGCYGIGVSRIMSAAIEQCHDKDGINWPQCIAPFELIIVEMDGSKNKNVRDFSNQLYEKFMDKKVEVLIDDRDVKLGIKLNDWELIGAPFILIIGKSEAENNSLTLKSKQVSGEKVTVSFDELLKLIES